MGIIAIAKDCLKISFLDVLMFLQILRCLFPYKRIHHSQDIPPPFTKPKCSLTVLNVVAD